MFSVLFGLGVAVMGAAALLPNGKPTFQQEINKILQQTKLKETKTEVRGLIDTYEETIEIYPECYEVQTHEKYIDCHIGLLNGQSYKDLANYIPLFETKIGKECEVLRFNKTVILRIHTAPAVDGTIKSIVNETMILEGIKNSKNEFVKVNKIIEEKTSTTAILDIPLGLSYKDLAKAISSLKTHFKNDVELFKNIDNEMGYKIYTAKIEKHYAWEKVYIPTNEGFTACIGMGREGHILHNFTKGSPHASIIGATGSGKSCLVNSIICSLLESYSHKQLQMDLLDFKEGSELQYYRDCKHVHFYTGDVNRGVEYLKELHKEMKERYKKMNDKRCRSIVAYNEKNKDDKVPYRLVIIDEMFSLLGLPKKNGHYELLADLLSKSRAAGIHFILTSQRPTSDVIPKTLYDHVSFRIGLKCGDQQQSINAIGQSGLEFIHNVGEGLICESSTLTRFQGFYLSDEKVDEITEKHNRPTKEVQKARFNKYIAQQEEKEKERKAQATKLKGSGKDGASSTKKR